MICSLELLDRVVIEGVVIAGVSIKEVGGFRGNGNILGAVLGTISQFDNN